MRSLLITSLLATAICGSSPAYAAQFLELSFRATGSGVEQRGSRDGTRPTTEYKFDQVSGTMYYNLTDYTPPVVTETGISYAGRLSTPVVVGQTNSNGFNFEVRNPPYIQFVSFELAGSACYANSSPFTTPSGSYALDPSCSQISVSYSDGFAVYGYDFEGIIQSVNFRVVEANDIPNITFSIPEPSTWALMLAGFAMTGYALRRKKARVALG